MLKKNSNYVISCLLLLIFTSLIYLVNYNTKEYFEVTKDTANTFRDAVSYEAMKYQEEQLEKAEDVFKDYWDTIYDNNNTKYNNLLNCETKFDAYMDTIKHTVESYTDNSPICRDLNLYEMDLGTDSDTLITERIRAQCRFDMLTSNPELRTLIKTYRVKNTDTERCEYLNNNY